MAIYEQQADFDAASGADEEERERREPRVTCRRCVGSGMADPRHNDRICGECSGEGTVTTGMAFYLGYPTRPTNTERGR